MKKRGKKKKTVKYAPENKADHEFLKLVHPTSSVPQTFGQKASDSLTKSAGSWTFIISFMIIFVVWIIVNTSYLIFGRSWDPYPFILLNLALSCLAAIQAPIILMSQNRENQRDRIRAKYDYAVNRKAEREIESLQAEVRDVKALLLGKINTRKLK